MRHPSPPALYASLVICFFAFTPTCHSAPDPEAELLTFRQVVETTPVMDTLGDFVATYSYRCVERDVRYSATDPAKKWTSHRSGILESARRGDWVSVSIRLAVPNPPEVGGNVEEQLYRFFEKDGSPAGMVCDRMYTTNQDNWRVVGAFPPFSTELGMGWDGKSFVDREALGQYLNQSYAQSGGMSRSASTRSDGVQIEEFLTPPLPGAPDGVTVRIRIARETEGSGTFLNSESGKLYSFPDGTSTFVPWATLTATRHVEGVAATLLLERYDMEAMVGATALGTASDVDSHLESLRGRGRFITCQEEYQLISVRRATTEDKITPADFAEEIEIVRPTETGAEQHVWQFVEGAEARRALLAYNLESLDWESVQ